MAPVELLASSHLSVGRRDVTYDDDIGAMGLGGSTGWQPAPTRTNPSLQRKPHEVPSHVAVAFAGAAGQGVQRRPHVSSDVLLTQRPSHAWRPSPHDAMHAPASQPSGQARSTRRYEHAPSLQVPAASKVTSVRVSLQEGASGVLQVFPAQGSFLQAPASQPNSQRSSRFW
jgi:hypothetical protein